MTSSNLWESITDPEKHANELLIYDEFPDKISLDRGQCVEFELLVYIRSETGQKFVYISFKLVSLEVLGDNFMSL